MLNIETEEQYNREIIGLQRQITAESKRVNDIIDKQLIYYLYNRLQLQKLFINVSVVALQVSEIGDKIDSLNERFK